MNARGCVVFSPFAAKYTHTVALAQLTSSIKENPKLRAAAEELHKAGVKVGDAVSEALRTMEESELMRAVHVFLLSLKVAKLTRTEDIQGFRRGVLHHRADNRADT